MTLPVRSSDLADPCARQPCRRWPLHTLVSGNPSVGHGHGNALLRRWCPKECTGTGCRTQTLRLINVEACGCFTRLLLHVPLQQRIPLLHVGAPAKLNLELVGQTEWHAAFCLQIRRGLLLCFRTCLEHCQASC